MAERSNKFCVVTEFCGTQLFYRVAIRNDLDNRAGWYNKIYLAMNEVHRLNDEIDIENGLAPLDHL